jgi:hypothetical protein
MKKVLSGKALSFALLAVTVLALAFYAYMLLRPISYGMEYYSNQSIDGYPFETASVFYRGNKMIIKNANFNGPEEFYYYLKDGYVFNCLATTDEEYLAEVEEINANWEDAVNAPFYANKINAFNLTQPTGDNTLTMECRGAKAFAVVFGIMDACLAALTAAAFVYRKKNGQAA